MALRISNWLLAVALLLLVSGASSLRAHEIRPAYLQITENADQRFDVLWKQPSGARNCCAWCRRCRMAWLDGKPTEESVANSFVVRSLGQYHVARASFDRATIRIDGLEYTITDALVSISFANGQDIQEILRPRSPALVVHLTGTGKVPVPAYLLLGIEHILTGFDHLSFVLGLLLLVRSRLRLVKTITAFTVAHSLTLAAAALGWVHVNPAVIEALVAFSIVFVALELGAGISRSLRPHGSNPVADRLYLRVAARLRIRGVAGADRASRTQHPGKLAALQHRRRTRPAAVRRDSPFVERAAQTAPAPPAGLDDLDTTLAIGGLASFWVIQRLHFLTQ